MPLGRLDASREALKSIPTSLTITASTARSHAHAACSASGVEVPVICTGLAENAYRVEVNVE